MTVSELRAGVTQRTALAVVLAALAGGWLNGAPGALGVLSGGAMALFSFRLLASRALAAAPGSTLTVPWMILAGLRFMAVGALAAVLFVAGWVHPVAWLVGYSALPVAVVLQGLRLAREEGHA